MSRKTFLAAGLLFACVHLASADAGRGADTMLDYLNAHQQQYAALAQTIWDKAELGYQETESSALLRDTLQAAGFSIETGVADIPTAFVASYGTGEPVIAFLAEFDALPGISQSSNPRREQVAGKDAGHACGHHLFGAGSTAAAIAAGGTSIGHKGMMVAAKTMAPASTRSRPSKSFCPALIPSYPVRPIHFRRARKNPPTLAHQSSWLRPGVQPGRVTIVAD